MSNAANTGSKYQAGRNGTEIAKLIRADVKAACKTDGPLKGCKVSVRYRSATHSTAIDIEVTEAPVTVLGAAHVLHYARTPHVLLNRPASERYTAVGHAILAALRSIASDYNRLDSDGMRDHFNDEFYLHVDFADALEDAQKAAILAPHPACCGCAECEDALAA